MADLLIMAVKPVPYGAGGTPEGERAFVTGILSEKQFKNNSYILTLSKAFEGGASGGLPSENPDKTKRNRDFSTVLVWLGETEEEDLPLLGEAVSVSGTKSYFEEARNPGQFDFRAWYHIRGVEYRLFDGIILKKGGRPDWPKELLYRLRRRISAVYDGELPQREAGILKAMALGDRDGLDPELRDLYRRNGIGHALSISGLHVSILGFGIYRLLRKSGAPRTGAGIACSILVLLYCVMTGGSDAALRATVMFVTCMGADLFGRTYDLLSALALAMLAGLIRNPLAVLDSGFLLSYGAVLGIGIIKPWLNTWVPFHDFPAVSAFLLSLSVTLFTLPVTLWFFFQIPVYSVFLNLVLVPFMGILLISSLILGITGLFLPPFALVFKLPCILILSLYEMGCGIAESLPGSLLIPGKPTVYQAVLYYILLLCLAAAGIRRERIRKRAVIREKAGIRKKAEAGKKAKIRGRISERGAVPGRDSPIFRIIGNCSALLILVTILCFRPSGGLFIAMLDIGQGDCNLIRGSGGTVCLIDCGSSTVDAIAEYRVIPCLKSLGISRVDCAVMTHSDRDHISGFEELFTMDRARGLPVKRFVMPELEEPDEAYVRLCKLAEEAGTEVFTIKKGDSFSMDGAVFRCLHPPEGYGSENANAYSTVLKLDYGSFTMMFTGDVEGDGEERLIQSLPESCPLTVLKVSHHGSRNSTPEEFLGKVTPSLSLISCGKGNSYGHPHPELMERLLKSGSRVMTTPDLGAILLWTDGESLRTRGFLTRKPGEGT